MSTRIDVDTAVIGLLGNKLYSQNQPVVFIRETLQNAIDAGATRIRVKIEYKDNKGTIEVSDNGSGIQDFQKYFLTIGGSSKRDSKRETNGSIGGFGIAKLSIMSMEDWSIKSFNGLINKSILDAGDDIQINVDLSDWSTIVKGSCTIWTSDIARIHDILCLTVKPGLNIQLICLSNGEPMSQEIQDIQAVELKTMNICGVKVSFAETLLAYKNHFVIRINGLYMYADSMYLETQENRCKCFIFDIQTNAMAYDDGYPLNANRESITNNDLISDYHLQSATVKNYDSNNQKIEKIKEANIREVNGFFLAGSLVKNDLKRYAFELKTWTRYITQLHNLYDDREDYLTGLSDKENSQAFRYTGDKTGYLLNPKMLAARSKAKILALAIHEFTHKWEDSHYDDFAVKENEIMSRVFAGLALKEFRW